MEALIKGDCWWRLSLAGESGLTLAVTVRKHSDSDRFLEELIDSTEEKRNCPNSNTDD